MYSIRKSIAFTLVLLSYTSLLAQQKGFGPHGGRLKTVGSYKIELLGCDNYLEVYLFDKDTNAIDSEGINGNVEFFYNTQATLSSPLIPYGMDGFTAKIFANTFLYSKPSININGVIVTEKFENECLMNASKN